MWHVPHFRNGLKRLRKERKRWEKSENLLRKTGVSALVLAFLKRAFGLQSRAFEAKMSAIGGFTPRGPDNRRQPPAAPTPTAGSEAHDIRIQARLRRDPAQTPTTPGAPAESPKPFGSENRKIGVMKS